MSAGTANDLVSAFTVLLTLLLALSLYAVIRLPRWPPLSPAAELDLGNLITQLDTEVREDAGLRARARGREQVAKKDIQAEYRDRLVRKMPRTLIGVSRYGGITISGAGFAIALPSLPHFPPLSPAQTKLLTAGGLAVAAIAMIYDSSEFLHDAVGRRREAKKRLVIPVQQIRQPASTLEQPPLEVLNKSAQEVLRRRGEQLARRVTKAARSQADENEVTSDDISDAWRRAVGPRKATAPAVPAARPRKTSVLLGLAAFVRLIVLAGALYFIFSWAKGKLPNGQYWPFIAIIAALFILYLMLVNLPRAVTAVFKRHDSLGDLAAGIARSLARLLPKGRALSGSLFWLPRRGGTRPISGNLTVTQPDVLQRSPALTEGTSYSDYAMRSEHFMTTPDQDPPSLGSAKAPPPGSAFSLGWLMAHLFGLRQRSPQPPGPGGIPHLPAVAELDPDSQTQLAITELNDLLGAYPGLSSTRITTVLESASADGFAAAVMDLHLELLNQLAGNPGQSNAYQLGRALHDACWEPQYGDALLFLEQFSRSRLATLQTWLAQAGDALAAIPAATVSRSLQNWQDWADVNTSQITGAWASAQSPMIAALRTQAEVWHAQLASQADMTGPISPDAWVHAGKSILRTTRTLTLTTLRRFWPIALVLAAATGGLLYLAIADSSGTAKVWTSLVTVAAALGAIGGSVRATARRAASAIEQDISRTAILDARAWSITWLPSLPQSRAQRSRLARRGVDPPQIKPNLEQGRARPSSVST